MNSTITSNFYAKGMVENSRYSGVQQSINNVSAEISEEEDEDDEEYILKPNKKKKLSKKLPKE